MITVDMAKETCQWRRPFRMIPEIVDFVFLESIYEVDFSVYLLTSNLWKF